MPGILGPTKGSRPYGILGAPTLVRQVQAPGQGASQGSPVMAGLAQEGKEPEYGSDEWAKKYYGPGGLLWREMMRGMMSGKNPAAVLDPAKAGQFFSPGSLDYLGK